MYNDIRKKQRGQKRRLNKLLRSIDEIKPFKHTKGKFEHFHVPLSPFIEHPKTSGKIKNEFIKKWILKVEQTIKEKPEGLEFAKVVGEINIPNLWDSQLIVFYSEKHYEAFFEDEGFDQTRTPIAYSLKEKLGISADIAEKGFEERIDFLDEHICDVWFFGEI